MDRTCKRQRQAEGHTKDGPAQQMPKSTSIMDLSSEIILQIMSLVDDVRTRNCMSLACRAWNEWERQTRDKLALKGNNGELQLVPQTFTQVEYLDLSRCSPWGYPLQIQDRPYLPALLQDSFPRVKSLKFYVREADDVRTVAKIWPCLKVSHRGCMLNFSKSCNYATSLVRWHNKAHKDLVNLEAGVELIPLLQMCTQLTALDLSEFHCWTNDVPTAMQACPQTASNLLKLNLLKLSAEDNFTNSQLVTIARHCPKLEELSCVCESDPRYQDALSDAGLLAIARSCTGLRRLCLTDKGKLLDPRSSIEIQESTLSAKGFIEKRSGKVTDLLAVCCLHMKAFSRELPELQDLKIMLSQRVQDGAACMEALSMNCSGLTSLHLGCFEAGGDLIKTMSSSSFRLSLRELTLKHRPGVSDRGAHEIADSFRQLSKLSLCNCPSLTRAGLRCLAQSLPALVEVSITQCRTIPTKHLLAALTPMRQRLRALSLDCDWRSSAPSERPPADGRRGGLRSGDASQPGPDRMPFVDDDQLPARPFWPSLKALVVWAPLGALLTPLITAGLDICPALAEVKVEVEGACPDLAGPGARAFGLACLACFPSLACCRINLSKVTGFSASCPPGFTDVSLWERFHLNGIQHLPMTSLEYWPPTDKDLNRRPLSMVSAGILSSCAKVRKLLVHGTVSEHVLFMLKRMTELRDVEVWGDYYPSPEDEMSSEMRLASSKRFEAAMLSRGYVD
eukprot:SM000180S03516  [mRNA]  locus=s180:225571:229166:- [translate_table: standard]